MTHCQSGRTRPVLLAACLSLVSIVVATLILPTASASATSTTTTTTRLPATTSSSVPSRPSAGCQLSSPIPPGAGVQAVKAKGEHGAYFREVPTSYNGRAPMPVIVDLHGYGVSAVQMIELTQLGTYGKSAGFITITPQVVRGNYAYWQTGFKSKDVAFLKAAIANVDSTLCVDQNRLFVTGFSNGAIMASVLACVDAGQVAAIAPVSGIANPARCRPARPVPVVAFHGTADPILSYTGGLGPGVAALPLPPGKANLSQLLGPNLPQSTRGPSIAATTAAWAKRDGCAAASTTRVVAKNVALISYACPGGNTVELYRIRGGGHTWPGSALLAKEKALNTTMAISADKIIWNFFSAHPIGG